MLLSSISQLSDAYLLARYLFETLGYRPCEWKCDALNAPSRAALRFWLRFRRHSPPAYDHQGPQPGHGVLFHARPRVAGVEAQLRALAGAG
jgi:hypothetical protein